MVLRKEHPLDHRNEGPCSTQLHGYTDAKDDYLKRLRRVEGQVRGIARMVDEDVYCIDILTQVAAVTKALQAVSIGLVEDHLAHCVVDAARQSPEEGAAKVKRSLRRHRPPRPQLIPRGDHHHEHHHPFGVDGMTCGHCVSAVTSELSALPGVHDVAIQLTVGGSSTVSRRLRRTPDRRRRLRGRRRGGLRRHAAEVLAVTDRLDARGPSISRSRA